MLAGASKIRQVVLAWARMRSQLGLLINGANAGWQVLGEEGGQDELIAAAEVLVEAQLRAAG